MAAPLFMGMKKRRPSSSDKQFLGDYINLSSNVHIQKIMQKAGVCHSIIIMFFFKLIF